MDLSDHLTHKGDQREREGRRKRKFLNCFDKNNHKSSLLGRELRSAPPKPWVKMGPTVGHSYRELC
jgi:hypothetical protein